MLIIISFIFLMNIMAISSSNIMMIWMFLEMSSYLFISFLGYNISFSSKSESMMIYFLMSFFSSIMILMSFSLIQSFPLNSTIMLIMNSKETFFFSSMIFFSMLIKIGSIPFHSWVFSMFNLMKFFPMMIFSTIQKIIPIWMMMMFCNNNLMISSLILSLVVFVLIPLKCNSMSYFMASSATMNNIWIMFSMMTTIFTTLFFSLIYFYLTFSMIKIMKKFNWKMSNNNFINMSCILILFSILGMPPLLGFFSKMNSIFSFNELEFLFFKSMMFIMIMMIVSNSLTSFMYMNYFIAIMISMKNSMMFLLKKKFFFHIIMNCFSPAFFIFIQMMN